jgi:hypothetical protein
VCVIFKGDGKKFFSFVAFPFVICFLVDVCVGCAWVGFLNWGGDASCVVLEGVSYWGTFGFGLSPQVCCLSDLCEVGECVAGGTRCGSCRHGWAVGSRVGSGMCRGCGRLWVALLTADRRVDYLIKCVRIQHLVDFRCWLLGLISCHRDW